MGIIFKHSLSSLKPTKYQNHVVKVCHNPGYGLQHLRLSTLKGGRKHQGCLPLCQHWLSMFPTHLPGSIWCYVDSAHTSSCQDLRFSARFPNNPWSYEACATPLPGYVCSSSSCSPGSIGFLHRTCRSSTPSSFIPCPKWSFHLWSRLWWIQWQLWCC